MFLRKKRKPIKSKHKLNKKIATRKLSSNRYRQRSPFSQSKNRQLKIRKKKRFKGNLRISRTTFAKKIFFSTITLGIIIGSIYIIFFSQVFKLKKWEIVEKEITFYNHYLDEFLKPYNGDNIIFINTEEIQKRIKEKHPNLSAIEIKKIFPSTISVKIQQYPIVANVINIVGEKKIEQKIIINSIGIAVEKDIINPELPIIKITSSKSFNLLDKIISPKKLKYITETTKEFEEAFGIKVTETEYKTTERELHLLTEKGFKVWLDSQKKSTIQLLKLKKALPKLDIYNTPLKYIDLRISGAENDKVIYKKK